MRRGTVATHAPYLQESRASLAAAAAPPLSHPASVASVGHAQALEAPHSPSVKQPQAPSLAEARRLKACAAVA